MRVRGLTLLELIVVLVVLGIASVIIYPIFANAREAGKRSLCFANLRRIGRAIAGYVEVNDGRYPIAIAHTKGKWNAEGFVQVPPQSADEHAFWVNSVDGADLEELSCPQAAKPESGALVSYVFNGILNTFYVSKIRNPSETVLLWEGAGKEPLPGVSRSNPILLCPEDSACLYRPNSGLEVKLYLPPNTVGNTMWVHGRGADFLMADLHVKWKRLAERLSPKRTVSGRDPYMTYDRSGRPTSSWPSVSFFHP